MRVQPGLLGVAGPAVTKRVPVREKDQAVALNRVSANEEEQIIFQVECTVVGAKSSLNTDRQGIWNTLLKSASIHLARMLKHFQKQRMSRTQGWLYASRPRVARSQAFAVSAHDGLSHGRHVIMAPAEQAVLDIFAISALFPDTSTYTRTQVLSLTSECRAKTPPRVRLAHGIVI